MKELARKILRIAYNHNKPVYVRENEIEKLLMLEYKKIIKEEYSKYEENMMIKSGLIKENGAWRSSGKGKSSSPNTGKEFMEWLIK